MIVVDGSKSGRAMKVLFTDYMQPDLDLERELCRAAGLKFAAADPQCTTPEQVIAAGQDADALVIQYAPLTQKVFAALPGLRIVSLPQIGVDSIALEAARKHGIWVANAPFGNITEVAAHTLAMALALLRGLPTFDRHVRAGGWDYAAAGELRRPGDLTYGILGLGRIGRLVAERARPFFGGVVACDPKVADADWPDFVTRLPDSASLFTAADIVSLHVPMGAGAAGLIGKELLTSMKPGSFLVNVARGPLVDRAALIAALDEGQLAGAALDVLPVEPPPASDPLLKHERILLSPHAAFYSREADAEQRRTAIDNIVDLLKTGRPRHVVVEGR